MSKYAWKSWTLHVFLKSFLNLSCEHSSKSPTSPTFRNLFWIGPSNYDSLYLWNTHAQTHVRKTKPCLERSQLSFWLHCESSLTITHSSRWNQIVAAALQWLAKNRWKGSSSIAEFNTSENRNSIEHMNGSTHLHCESNLESTLVDMCFLAPLILPIHLYLAFYRKSELCKGETIENTIQRGICMRGRHSGFMYVFRERRWKTQHMLACCYCQCGDSVVMKNTVAMLLSDEFVTHRILFLHHGFHHKENRSVCLQ